MADTNTRQGKRTPVTLKIKFKSETLEQFIERYAVDVSQGGIFIRTKEPLAVGTQMKFEFQLRDASPLIAGEGTVVWTRENDPSRPAIAPGMGVRFDKLADGSQQVLEKILAEKAKQAPQRSHTEPTKPPMFTDTPTRVAPAPVQEALLGGRAGTPRPRSDSEQTPLPKPMPFHSDADEFPEEAFEEATKVRSLDELVAQTAEAEPKGDTKTAIMPLDELAARRQTSGGRDSTVADSPTDNPALATKNEPDRESAPGLPSPPAVDAASGRKVLDTSPSPRQRRPSEEKPAERTSKSSIPPAGETAKTKLGMEPAKASTASRDRDREEGTEKVDRAAPKGVATETSRPIAPGKPSAAPIIIGVGLLVVMGLAALWFFVLRQPAADNAAKQGSATEIVQPATGSADTGSAVATTGSADTGSANAMTGSAGSAVAMTGSAAPVKTVDTVIASPAAKATVEIEGIGQSGPAPFTAKLEKDKTYKARVTAPGFMAKEIDVKGGEKATAKLDAKPRTLSVTSEPAGAEIYIDGASTGQQTPAEVKVAGTKAKVRVTLRKAGFRALDQQFDAATFTEDDTKLSGTVSGKLEKAPVVVNTGGTGTHTGSATQTSGGTGAGSATTGTSGAGTGSATSGGTSGTGTAGSGTTGTGTTGTGTTGTSGTGTGTTGTGTTGTGTTGTGTTGTGTTGTGTSGTGTTGTGTSGTGTTGTGTGSAKSGGEPEPDWTKQK